MLRLVRPMLSLIFAVAFTTLIAMPAWAICEAGGASKPNVSFQPTLPDDDGNVSILVTYGFPNTNSHLQRLIRVYRDGVFLFNYRPDDTGGTKPFDNIPFTCLATGSYELLVTAEACGKNTPDFYAEAKNPVPINTTPTVDLTYSGPDEFGNLAVSVDYKFPNTNNHLQRRLEFYRDGVLWKTDSPLQRSDQWPFPHSVACLAPGTHSLAVLARSCDQFTDTVEKSVTVQTTPEVSISSFGPDLAGNTTLTVPYKFLHTLLPSSRSIRIFRNGVNVKNDNAPDTSGTRTYTVPGTCTSTWRVLATACGQFTAEDTDEASEKKTEVKSIALLKTGFDQGAKVAILQTTVVYDLQNPNGTVQLELENWVDADGKQWPGGPLITYQVPADAAPSGTKVFTFNAPSGAQQVSVVAKATTSCGTAKKSTATDCQVCLASANPVYYSDGNMRLSDADPLPPLAGRSLVRTYNSDEQVVALFGRGWTTFLDRRIIIHTGAVSVTTETNEVVRFEQTAGVFRQTWPTARRELGTLTHDVATGTYSYRAPGATEVAVFRATDGQLAAVRDTTAARELVVSYDAQGRPISVTDSVTAVAWNLTFAGTQRRVTSIGVTGRPDLAWSYSYDANGNLLTVLAPGSSPWRTYEYAANRMTASRDALGNLIESHTYDANGFAVNSTGDVDEIETIEYGLPGFSANERVTRVTYRSGAVAEHILRPIGNGWRPVQVTGGCASCGTHDATYVYDERGRVIREQGADGYVTVTVYTGDHVLSERRSLKPTGCDPQTDTQHCRLAPDALAAALLEPTGATTTITYEHADPLWPDKVTATVRPSVGASGEFRRDHYVYHPITGAIVSMTICGFAAGDPECSERTTLRTFYEGGSAGLAPAFDPGGSFQSAWLVLPQPSFLLKSMDGPRTDVQDVSSFVYYPIDPTVPALLRGRLAATKNAVGQITHYEDYDVFGNVTRVVDPNGVTNELTFDALGRPLTTTTKATAGCNTTLDPLCATDLTTTQVYSPASGPLLRQERPGGGVTSYTYDARGRMATVSRGPSAASLRERIETSYDPLTGKKSLERTLGFEAGTWVEKSRQSFAYDAQARLQTVTHADGAAIHYTYDAEDRIATIRDENHAAPNTFYAYDSAGRLESVKQTLAGAPSGIITTQYAYDTAGNLISVTDPNGNITSYVYDDFGQLTAQSSPVTGTTTYQYDEAGNLTQTTDANAATTERTYDAAGRVLTAVSTRDGNTETVHWAYDSATAGAYGLGRLASMDDPSGLTEYSYERRGLLRQETQTILGSPFVQTYGYDANGNRKSIGYPSGRIVTYTFDDAGRPLTATGTIAGQNTSYVTAASYLPFGPMTSLTLGNGTSETRTYNARYLPLTSSLTGGANTIAQYAYTNDPAGNITALADATNAGYNRTFGYDDLNRLTVANTGSALWGTGSFTYDRMGNMLTSAIGTTRTFTHQGTTPRINTATGLTGAMAYDAAGNELKSPAGDPSDGAPRASYSPRNLLSSQFVREYDRCVEELGSACFQPDPVQEWHSNVYDGRGVRVLSIRNIISLGGAIGIEEPQPDLYFYTPELTMLNIVTPTRTADVIWFGSRPVADHGEGGVRYTFTDHLGTPILQTTATAAVTWRVEYEPFGNVYALRAGSTSDDQPLRFPGQQVAYRTLAGEENYNIFRWYRSGWGRYTQADPVGNQAGTFAYALDDPIGKVDPRGLTPCIMKLNALINQPDAALTFIAAVLQECGSDPVKSFFTEASTPKYNPAKPITTVNGIPISADLGVTTGDGSSSWVFQTAFDKGAKQIVQTSGHEVYHQVMRHRKVPYKSAEEADADMFGWMAAGQFSKLTDCECALCQ